MRTHEKPIDGPDRPEYTFHLCDRDGKLQDEISAENKERWEQSGLIEFYGRDEHELEEYYMVIGAR